MDHSADRRRHARYPFDRPLELRGPTPYGRIFVRAYDISESGFSFVSDVRLAVGDRIELALRHDDSFSIEAIVRNVRIEGGVYVVGAERVSQLGAAARAASRLA